MLSHLTETSLTFQLPALYPLIPATNYDYNLYTEQDSFTAQNVQGKSARLITGKMLGGSSSLHEMFHTRSNSKDFQRWSEAAGEGGDIWNFDDLLPYYTKSERIEDKLIANSDSILRGKDGPIGLTRRQFQANQDIIKSFTELGYDHVLDFNGNQNLGVTEPLLRISNGVRQSMAEAYLVPVKHRTNLFVYTMTTASKIIFDSNDNAVGVKAFNSCNETVTIYARREVIVSAGTMKSAQLLLLSGIGPMDTLHSWGLYSRSDLPVGQAVRDQVGAIVAFRLRPSNRGIPPFDPKRFPLATTIALKSLDGSKFPEYQSVNTLFRPNSLSLEPVCKRQYKFVDTVCNKYLEANCDSDLFFSAVYGIYQKSFGRVMLQSDDVRDDPWVYMGTFTQSEDLTNLAYYLQDHAKIINTRFFKGRRAQLVDLGFDCNYWDKTSFEFWQCYGRTMSTLMQKPLGSCPMGPVLDPTLNVHGVHRLRVVGAAAIPTVGSGDLRSDVVVLAEKAADLIKACQ